LTATEFADDEGPVETGDAASEVTTKCLDIEPMPVEDLDRLSRIHVPTLQKTALGQITH
jgi:hypothetical protein